MIGWYRNLDSFEKNFVKYGGSAVATLLMLISYLVFHVVKCHPVCYPNEAVDYETMSHSCVCDLHKVVKHD